jgi:chromosome segregation ATPase
MKVIAIACLLCTINGVSAGAEASAGHPIEKVIKMLKGLKTKAIMEGKEEAVAYEKFVYWCQTSISTLKDAIAEEKETIADLKDKLAGLEKDKETLEEDIETLEEQIAELDASAKKAKEMRDDEAKLYKKANKDLEDTIDAVEQCIKALTNAESKTEAKMLLAQHHVKMVLSLVSTKATEKQRKGLEEFVKPRERPDEQYAKGDLAAHTDKYDFKSENVIELLKQLKLAFEDEKLAGTKAETNAINAYDLAKEARDNAKKAANKSKDKKEKELSQTESDIKDAEGKLKDTEDDLAADSKSLEDTEDQCSTRKDEWETRSKTRTLEIAAMDEAVKILAKSSGVRTEAPGNPVPPPSPLDFMQVGQVSTSADPKMKAVALLREAAKNAHSRALERLAVEVQAHLKGPFDQVNNMIEKMIFRLMDEQKQEDEHKLWCDQEIKQTNTMKEDKEDKIKDLTAEIKKQKATVQKLADEIEEAEKMIADVIGFMGEATEIREVGKKENDLAIKDAVQAQKSVTDAIAVLKTFYKESGEIPKEPWEFIQAPVKLPKDPKLWSDSYTGVADPDRKSSGIITILENVLSDFEKMEADTKSNEAEDQKEYEEAMQANKIEKAERTQEVEMKKAESARRNEKIASLEGQKKSTSDELEKTEQYLEDLKPACVDGDSSYEDRKAARTKEIEALKKAKGILADAFNEKADEKALKFLQISRHHAM